MKKKQTKEKRKEKLSPLEIAFIDQPTWSTCAPFQLTGNCWKSSKIPTGRKLLKHSQYWSNNSWLPVENDLLQRITWTKLLGLFCRIFELMHIMTCAKANHVIGGSNKLRRIIKFHTMWWRTTVMKNNYFQLDHYINSFVFFHHAFELIHKKSLQLFKRSGWSRTSKLLPFFSVARVAKRSAIHWNFF